MCFQREPNGCNIGVAVRALFFILSFFVSNLYTEATGRVISETISSESCLVNFDVDCNWANQASVTTWNAVFYLDFGVNVGANDPSSKYEATATFYWGEDSLVTTTTEVYETNALMRLAEQHFYSQAGEYEVGFSLTFGAGAGGCVDRTKYHSVLISAQESSCSLVDIIDSNMDSATFDISSSVSTVASVTAAVFPTPYPTYTSTLGLQPFIDSPFPTAASPQFPTWKPTAVSVAWTSYSTSSTALFVPSSTPSPTQIEQNPTHVTSQPTLRIEASVTANTHQVTPLPTTMAPNSIFLTFQPTHQMEISGAENTQQPASEYQTGSLASDYKAESTALNPSSETNQTPSPSLTSTEIGQNPSHITFQPGFEAGTLVSPESPTANNSSPEVHTIISLTPTPTGTAVPYTFAWSPTSSPTHQTRSRTDGLNSDMSFGSRSIEDGKSLLFILTGAICFFGV